MDRGKSLEFLRGMKFMQRKEEAKRREIFQAEQDHELREKLAETQRQRALSGISATDDVHATPAAHRRSSGPTIVLEDSMPLANVTAGRRVFRGIAASAVVPVAPRSNLSTTEMMQHVDFDLPPLEYMTGSGSETAVAPSSSNKNNQPDDEVDGGDAPALSGKRFTLKDSVRAPKAPKRLEKEVAESAVIKKRQRELDAEEEALYASDPRTRF